MHLSSDKSPENIGFGRVKGRILLALFGLALAAGVLVPSHGAHAAISFIQQNATDPGGVTQNSTAFSSNNTTGNLIVVVADWNNIAANISSVNDTAGNALCERNRTGQLARWAVSQRPDLLR
jgi:hypothetical protein